MWWIVILAALIVALVAGWLVDRRRHPRDVDGQAHQEQRRREGSPGGFIPPGSYGGG